MRYTEAIQAGIRVVHRNWQLVLIQVSTMFASFIGFFIVVGIPLFIAFVIFGLDLTELSRFEDIFRSLRQPVELLSRYFVLVILVLTSLLLYVTAVLAVGIFLFGGSIGVLSRSIENSAEKFRFGVFLSEGKRLFFPLIGFTTLVGLIFILVAFVLGLFGGLISAVVSIAKEQEATLALFLGVFFSLILSVIGLTLILATLSITVYGSAVMTMKKEGPLKSLKDSARYLYAHSSAFYFYCLVFVGYLFLSFVVVSVSYPLGMIPLAGSFLALVYHFGAYIIQSYLGLVMIAGIFCYYHSETAEPASGPGPLPVITSAEEPREGPDTAGPQAPGQGEPPHGMDRSSTT